MAQPASKFRKLALFYLKKKGIILSQDGVSNRILLDRMCAETNAPVFVHKMNGYKYFI